MKWLPNALTILRCILAFVVGWAIWVLGAGYYLNEQFLLTFNGVGEKWFDTMVEPAIFGPHTLEIAFSTVGSSFIMEDYLPPILFFTVAASDYFDGYFARKLNAVSEFGAWLDPIADKLLVAISLFTLCHIFEYWWVLFGPTLAIIARDLLVTWLRSKKTIVAPVSRLAKWKTAFELIGIGLFLFSISIFSLYRTLVFNEISASAVLVVGTLLLYSSLVIIWLAAALSLYTGYQYVRAAFSKPAP